MADGPSLVVIGGKSLTVCVITRCVQGRASVWVPHNDQPDRAASSSNRLLNKVTLPQDPPNCLVDLYLPPTMLDQKPEYG